MEELHQDESDCQAMCEDENIFCWGDVRVVVDLFNRGLPPTLRAVVDICSTLTGWKAVKKTAQPLVAVL